MLGVARLALDVDEGVLGRQRGEDALVVDLDDVDLVLRRTTAPPRAARPGRSWSWIRSRAIRPERARSRSSTLASSRVSILPPVRTSPTLRPRKRSGWASKRGEAGRAGAFGHRLLDLEQQADRRLDVALGDQQDLVDQRVDRSRPVSAPGSLTAMPSAIVSPAQGSSLPLIWQYMRRDTARPGRRSTSMSGLERLAPRSPMPEISPPPPIGTTSVSRSGASASISSATVPWPGNDLGIVERVDEGQRRAPRASAQRLGIGLVERLAVEHDLGAMALGLR